MRLFILFLSLFATGLQAQVRADLATMPTGSTYSYLTESGTAVWTFLGPIGDLYSGRWEYFDVDMNRTVWVSEMNAHSQGIIGSGQGIVMRFEPHDCWLSIGDCVYTQTINDAPETVILTVTEYRGGVFRIREKILRGADTYHYDNACIVLDDEGINLATYIVYNDGYVEWSLRDSGQEFTNGLTPLDVVKDLCAEHWFGS